MNEMLSVISDIERLVARARAIAEADQPTPAPTPTPEPSPSGLPERTGKPSWTGAGKFNTFKEIADKVSPSKRVRVRAWFKASAWTGGGKEQPEGFALANKGVVGSHWGFSILVRPGGIVANGTKGEVVGAVKVSLGAWHYLDMTIEKRKVTCEMDGEAVAFPTPAIDLLQASSEPLRIGGFRCPWPAATWFNQSINGAVTDWQVEIA